MRQAIHRLCTTVFFLLALISVSSAQTSTATLKGVVTDNTGAVTPGATVNLTQVSTGTKRTFTTDTSGQFTFTFIEPGQYALEVQGQGFKRFTQDGVKLEVGQLAELNVTLEPGNISETINITADQTALQLDTGSAALGGVIERNQVDALPLNGRNVLQLAQLEPGVNTSPGSRRANPGLGAVAEISINGGRPLTNEIVIDGSTVTQKADNLPSLRPSPDSVQEFRIATNAYSAEYGRTGGGALNFSIRSGGAKYRGTLYEYLRNDAFDAKTFFANATNSPKEKLRFNQFGGNFGGPVWLPRFGEGGPGAGKADKLFFFFNYEGLRIRQSNLFQNTVPTEKMRNGDFSELLGATIANTTVRDTNGNLIPARQGMIYAPGAVVATGQPGAGSRVVFANNIIPAARINTVAKNALAYYPLPNRTGLAQNYVVNSPQTTANSQYTVRLDYNISQRHNLYGRWIGEVNENTNQGTFPGLISSTVNQPFLKQTPGSAVVDYVWTITPRVIAHANVGATRFENNITTFSKGFNPSQLGLPGFYSTLSDDAKIFPTFAPVGYTQLGPNRNFANVINAQDTWSFTEDMSLLLGAHTIKFGANQRHFKVYNSRPDDPAGNFAFTRAFTARTATDTTSGDAMASLLLGNPSSGRLAIAPQPAVASNYMAFFVQDDWQVNRRLTLNLGFRYEIDYPNTERFNRLTNFDLNAQFPVNSITVAFPAATGLGSRTIPLRGVVTPVGRGGVSNREQSDRDLNNFAPRIGLAFKLNDKTVIRAGGGLYYSSLSGGGLSNASYAIGDLVETTFVASLDGGVTPNPNANLSNPFPNGIVFPTSRYEGPLTGYGQTVPARLRAVRMPVVPQWNLNIQRDLPGKIIAQVGYAGSAGIGLFTPRTDLNTLSPEVLALGETILNTRVNNPFLALPVEQRPAASSGLGTATLTVAQLLRPFPQFGLVQSYAFNEAHSTYHSLQIKVSRRFSDGLSFTAGYAFSKLIDDVSSLQGNFTTQSPVYQDYYNRRADKSLSTFDVRHRLTANVLWNLPFGNGRRWAKEGVLSHIIGGFALNGLTQAQSGYPLAVIAANPTVQAGLSFVQLRPNLIADPKGTGTTKGEQVAAWFNPAAFQQPATYKFGNAPRTLPGVRSQGFFATNLSLSRDFKFTENTKLQFRAEGFNLFNRANFSYPVSTLGAAGFGRINATEDARQMQFALRLYF
ncbi:MAG TPA: carboxypeptidase-like regulatory domain-containing protein [Blastocatellia bacterium]|nr:carboxypeptidase-like regulatory domain-containing protein [Blastocatellia bacterium]